ncbi:MAG: hypothetical protein IKK75_16295 [Clostridia bacterium]|nr:hypothetical protein [Clostridia bacterium]
MKDKRGSLIALPLALFALIGAIGLGYAVVLAFTDYTVFRGLFGSAFVGFDNFARLVNRSDFKMTLYMSLLQTFLTVIIALPFAALGGAILSSIGNRAVKAGIAGAMLVIAIVPDVLWAQLGLMLPFDYQEEYVIPFVISKIVPQIALCLFGGLCLNLAEEKSGAAGALAVSLLPLTTVLLPDIRMNLFFGTPSNRIISDTLSMSSYRYGLLNMQYSLSGAQSVAGILISLFVGLIPALLIGKLASRKPLMDKEDLEGNVWQTEGLAAVGCALAAGVIALGVTLGSGTLNLSSATLNALLNTLLIALLCFIPALALCAVALVCSRYCRSGIPFGMIALVLGLLSAFTVCGYMTMRNLGMINTLLAPALGALKHPVFIAVLFVLMCARPTSPRQLLLTIAGGAMVAAAVSAGDWFSQMLSVNDNDLRGLAFYLRQALMTSSPDSVVGTGSTLLLAVTSVLGALGAGLVMAGIGGAELTRAQNPYDI